MSEIVHWLELSGCKCEGEQVEGDPHYPPQRRRSLGGGDRFWGQALHCWRTSAAAPRGLPATLLEGGGNSY